MALQLVPGADRSEQLVATNDFPDGAFAVRRPASQSVPFLFNSPHSGRHYPDRLMAMSRLDRWAIRRSEDCFVDELFASVTELGAPLLIAHFPRAYLDVNREPMELDPKMFRDPLPPGANIRSARVAGGLGTVPRLVGEGQEIYTARLPVYEALRRIETLYHPYHECLAALCAETYARFGTAVLVDCHSMPANIKLSEGVMRPDFIVGDRFGASASPDLSAAAISLLRGMGYTVAHNIPYAGGFITEHYGRPTEALHTIQIEINRGLYMNERTLEKTVGFAPLQADLRAFAQALIDAWWGIGLVLPQAAE